MPVLSLQKIALEKLFIKDILKMQAPEKGVATRILLEYLEGIESMNMFKRAVAQQEGHICRMRQFDVWHGMNVGPRKFRNKTVCKCICEGTGSLCSCDCGAIFKMMIEYRENEVFRGYKPMQRSHKKARRFIPKQTSIKDITSTQFQDPHPYQRS